MHRAVRVEHLAAFIGDAYVRRDEIECRTRTQVLFRDRALELRARLQIGAHALQRRHQLAHFILRAGIDTAVEHA